MEEILSCPESDSDSDSELEELELLELLEESELESEACPELNKSRNKVKASRLDFSVQCSEAKPTDYLKKWGLSYNFFDWIKSNVRKQTISKIEVNLKIDFEKKNFGAQVTHQFLGAKSIS